MEHGFLPIFLSQKKNRLFEQKQCLLAAIVCSVLVYIPKSIYSVYVGHTLVLLPPSPSQKASAIFGGVLLELKQMFQKWRMNEWNKIKTLSHISNNLIKIFFKSGPFFSLHHICILVIYSFKTNFIIVVFDFGKLILHHKYGYILTSWLQYIAL